MTLVHGDFHLGQLGRRAGPWVLLDVDDLGAGDPAWDLARPAGFWAAGLIPDDDWAAFVDSYRDAGGAALPAGDPWPVLDPFARAAVVQAAAHQPDDELLRAACVRML
jgi:aminoglycoside phosphotransferase (APT) family kinase protein